MSEIDAIDDLGDGIENITEMQPYTLHWTSSYSNSWNGREVSLLLPSDTQFSKGMKISSNNGQRTRAHEFADASSGIPVSKSGEAIVSLRGKTRKEEIDNEKNIVRTSGIRVLAKISFSLLPTDVSKENYLNQVKNKKQVLFENENSVITKTITPPFSDTLEKTIIDRNLVLKIEMIAMRRIVNSRNNSIDLQPDQLLKMIQLAPQTNNS